MRKIAVVLVFICSMVNLLAQQTQKIEQLDSVFIDSKKQIPRKNSGKVIAVISSESLERSVGKSVAQLVNEVSGIEINGSRSNDGQNLGYFIRGGRNRQVVVMIDGVQLSDPSQIANDYDMRLIPASSIERIEIIKGASSVLYGSGAATAVISITSKKASDRPISSIFSATLGSNRSTENKNSDIDKFTGYSRISGTLDKFFYSMNFSNRFVGGLSSIAAGDDEALFEEDVFNRYNGRINLGYRFNKNTTMSRFFSFDNFNAGFDDFSYTDADYQSYSRQTRTGGHFKWKFPKGVYIFSDNFSWIEREIMSSFPAKYDSRSFTIDNYLTYNFSDQLTSLIGLNYNSGRFNSFSIPFGANEFNQDVDDELANTSIVDPYVNFVFLSSFGLNLNAGARWNIHSDYGNHFVYNFNPSYNFDFGGSSLKLLGSYSTAYITPSLFQLYDPFYGNEALQPEENTTLEVGMEYSLEDNLRISAVYFNRKETNYIEFVNVDPKLFTYQYQNMNDEFSASGVEVEVSKKFDQGLNVQANYTFTQADDRFALRIPEHKVNANIGYQLCSKSYLGLHYQFNSNREDSFFNPLSFESENITLDSYGLFDMTASHQLLKNFKIFATLSNLFDEEYEELYRFQTRGRNIEAGFTLEF